MIAAIGFVIAALVIIIALLLVNNLIIKKSSSESLRNIFRIIISIIASLIAGGAGFFLTFALGEGLMEVLRESITMPVTFAVVAVFNFIVCLFIGMFYSRSIWFAWFLVNPIVWLVLITNPAGPGGFTDLWLGWTLLVVAAFLGSLAGFLISRKKAGKSL